NRHSWQAPVQPDVDPDALMHQRPRGHEVQSEARESRQGLERNAAARLGERPSADQLDGAAQASRREVVEQDDVCAGGEDRSDLVEPVDLHLDRQVRRGATGALDGVGKAASGVPRDVGKTQQREMVVLEHHALLGFADIRSEEHTSELQSRENLVCRLLLEQKQYKDDNKKNTLKAP